MAKIAIIAVAGLLLGGCNTLQDAAVAAADTAFVERFRAEQKLTVTGIEQLVCLVPIDTLAQNPGFVKMVMDDPACNVPAATTSALQALLPKTP